MFRAPSWPAVLRECRCVEPEKRMVAGKFGWAIHRFEVKGGKTPNETFVREWNQRIAANVTKNNALFSMLKGTR